MRRTLAVNRGRSGKLIAAQSAWIAFRDAECEAEAAGSIGGSIHSMDVAACRSRLTKGRTSQLAAIAKGR